MSWDSSDDPEEQGSNLEAAESFLGPCSLDEMEELDYNYAPKPVHEPWSDPMKFDILKARSLLPGELFSPRLGLISAGGRVPIYTPNYIAITSRGSVPHVAQDILEKVTEVSSLFLGLEDFIEKAPYAIPPIFRQVPNEPFKLSKFIANPDPLITFLAPRRCPPVELGIGTTSIGIAVSTSVGYRSLECSSYNEAVQTLHPDAVFAMADLPPRPSLTKRREKMSDRSSAWLANMIMNTNRASKPSPAIIAPILPIDTHEQSLHLDCVMEQSDHIFGLSLHKSSSRDSIPRSLEKLPRFLLDAPASPHALLSHVSLGIDMFTVPFITECSERGVALTFTFPAPPLKQSWAVGLPLGIDCRLPQYAAEMKPLVEGCACYTCKKLSRAWINHLLNSKEMTAWTLLQIHNIHTMEEFFKHIRESIMSERFESDVDSFYYQYHLELPKGSSQIPTRRGYQAKPEPGNTAKPKSYNKFKDVVEETSSPELIFRMSDPEDRVLGSGRKTMEEMTLETKMLSTMRLEAENQGGEDNSLEDS